MREQARRGRDVWVQRNFWQPRRKLLTPISYHWKGKICIILGSIQEQERSFQLNGD